MHPRYYRLLVATSLGAFLFGGLASGRAAAFDPPVPMQPNTVNPYTPYKLPIGKAMILPIPFQNPEGDPINFSAISSDPNVLVRVRTGNPRLILHLQQGTLKGDLEFLLFRDLAPKTAETVTGLAAGGFYSPKSDGNGNTRTVTFSVQKDYGLLGGDPNSEVTSASIPSGGSTVTVDRGPGFAYDNEFSPALIFAGYGQLAMVNSGYDANKRGTNGSQFLITTGAIRSEDFQYPIVGQLVRGFDLLWKLNATATTGAGSTTPATPIQITGCEVAADRGDAYLIVGGKALTKTPAAITVSAATASPLLTEHRYFYVNVVPETISSPPFFSTPLDNQQVVGSGLATISMVATDLQENAIVFDHGITTPGFPIGTTSLTVPVANLFTNQSSGSGTLSVLPTSIKYTGPMNVYASIHGRDMTNRGPVDAAPELSYSAATVEETAKTYAISVNPTYSVAGQPLAATSVIAQYSVANGGGSATDAVAQINWGDGQWTVVPNSANASQFVIAPNPLLTVAPKPDPSDATGKNFQIISGHTYHNPGVYPVTVKLTDPNDLTAVLAESIGGSVVADPNQIATPIGRDVTASSGFAINATVAQFADSSAGSNLASIYSATIDWGDGISSSGSIAQPVAGGTLYSVTGSHQYPDAEKYAIQVYIHRIGEPVSTDVCAWSTATVTGVRSARHLPPFAQAHLDMSWQDTTGFYPEVVSGAKVNLYRTLTVENTGTAAVGYTTMRFFLSPNKTLTPANATRGHESPDIPLSVGPQLQTVSIVPLYPPGSYDTHGRALTSKVTCYLDAERGDFSLRPIQPTPAGYKPLRPNFRASGLNLIAEISKYNDPIADNQPTQRICVEKVSGFQISPTSVQVDQGGGTADFYVRLDQPPGRDSTGKDVTFTTHVTTGNDAVATASPSMLTFTNSNWAAWQKVTVTGVDNYVAPNGTYFPSGYNTSSQNATINLGPAQPGDTGAGHGILDGITGSVSVMSSSISKNMASSPGFVETSSPSGAKVLGARPNVQRALVRLLRQPKADVTVTVTANPFTPKNSTATLQEALLSTLPTGASAATSITLTFHANDTSREQDFYVVGQDDGITQTTMSPASYTISFSPAVSADPEFNNVTLPTISGQNDRYPPGTH